MNFLIAFGITFFGLFIFVPIVFGIARLFGIVRDRRGGHVARLCAFRESEGRAR
jgi:hypothetical protein